MLDREMTVALAKRMLTLHESGTTDQAPDVYRIPASDYVDPDRFQRELDRIFRRVPLPLALSCELREPGAYKALDAVGTPVLIVRGADAVVRAFVNSCRHRASIVVPDGCGQARRFTCPYHGWSYDQAGCLAGIYGEESFGTVAKDTMGLVELPCVERAGLVFVTLRPGEGMDIDEWLGDLGPELAALELDRWHPFGTRELPSAAWKVAYDGYLECYHFASLHRNTIYRQNMSNLMAVDSYGPHQRTLFAKHTLPSLREQPEEEWEPAEHIGPVHTLFPCLAIAGAWRDTALVSLLLPGPTPDRSRTVQTFLTLEPVVTDDDRRRAEAADDFLFTAVRDEDNPMGEGITRALMSGATTELVFGRNEPTLHHFHGWVDRLLEG